MTVDDDWKDVSERAFKEFEKSDLDLDHLDIRNPGNMLLFYFFQEAHKMLQQQEADRDTSQKFSLAFKTAMRNLQEEPVRCFDAITLKTLVKGVGDRILEKVQKYLWSKSKPPDPSAEEREHVQERIRGMKEEVRRVQKEKRAEKRPATVAPAASDAAFPPHHHHQSASSSVMLMAGGRTSSHAAEVTVAAAGGTLMPIIKPPRKGRAGSKAAGSGNPTRVMAAASPAVMQMVKPSANQGKIQNPPRQEQLLSGSLLASQPPKRVPEAVAEEEEEDSSEGEGGMGAGKKQAFMIVLYMSSKQGLDHETKESLMTKAESSGLSNKSLYGDGPSTHKMPGMKWYDGWSSVNKNLVNRTPPLVQVWSNPKKVRLTQEGRILAAKLYKDAMDRCKITALPGVDPDLDIIQQDMIKEGGADVRHEAIGAAAAAPGAQQQNEVSSSVVLPSAAPQHHQSSRSSAPEPAHCNNAIVIIDSSDDEGRECGNYVQRIQMSSQAAATLAPSQKYPLQTLSLHHQSQGLPCLNEIAPLHNGHSAGNHIRVNGSASELPIVHTSSHHHRAPAASAGAACSQRSNLHHADGFRTTTSIQGGPSCSVTSLGSRSQLGAGLRGASGSGATSPCSKEGCTHTGVSTSYQWEMERLGAVRNSHGGKGNGLRVPPLPRGVPFEELYEVVLVLDQREQIERTGGKGRTESLTAHAQRIRDKGVAVISDLTLPVGDAVWVARHRSQPSLMYILDYIMERKSVSDLASSIKDQRYIQQKYILKLCGLPRTYYLLEGDPDMDSTITEIERKSVKTASLETALHGFHVLNSSGPPGTLLLLANLTKAVERAYRGCMADPEGSGSHSSPPLLSEWSAHIKRLRSSLTVRDIFGLMLCSVPGAGETLVEAILQRFPTWHNLWDGYKSVISQAVTKGADPDIAADVMLASIPVASSGISYSTSSTSRTVGAELSRKVYRLLFKNQTPMPPRPEQI
ncbi:hypothetical protein CEUSTIGMA_g9730.t1 [Chlamydomonas eustigma]|uniref:Crossover junction endonuclease MUS81 n=1 Tax=Chlamydomonas eustigma TaxID=1157962 RepID=A0A250XGU9_9CHLO|nr:hypothetical protein CEUSTIGMA_g9730.t1 [Chlamydomonas eustigma]|eukprot:GAX82301.1 hypothetical protein CEUSTIGMA_g9730.t1 [Chlamydomonas eustigma]